MALIKQGGNLTQVSQEELLKQQPTYTPISPSASKAQGANPDQAKMAGTPAQKQALYKTAPEAPTLQQAQRQVAPVTPEPSASQQAKEKLERMKSLGTLNVQIENLIQGKLNAAAQVIPTQASINADAIAVLPEEKRQRASTLLTEYASLTDPAAKQPKLVEIAQALGHVPTDAELAGFYNQAPDVLKASIQQATPTSVSVADLGLANPQQVADDLGISIEDLNAMTVEQLQNAVQNVESQEYNRIQDIQAQLVTATGARREQLLRELGGEAQVGTTGVEAQFDTLQQQLEESTMLNIGGQDMSLEAILSDDALSNLITDAATDEAKLKVLAQTEPALAKWITDNKASLESLAAGMREEARAFGAVQDEASKAASDLSAGAFEALFGKRPEYMTQAELDALKANIQNNAVYKVMQSDPAFKTIIETDPKIAASLKGKSDQEIKALVDQYNAIKADPQLAEALGITDVNSFPTSSLNITEIKDALDKYTDSTKKKQVAKWLKDGDLTTVQAKYLADNMAYWPEVESEINYGKDYAKAASAGFDKLVEFIFGGSSLGNKAKDITKSINDKIKELSSLAVYDPEAAKLLEQYKGFAGPDGVFDAKDMANMQNNLKSSGIDQVASGKAPTAKEKVADLVTTSQSTYQNPEIEQIRNVLADNKLGMDEIMGMSESALDRLSSNAYVKAHFPDAARFVIRAKTIKSIGSQSLIDAFSTGQLGPGVSSSKQEKLLTDLINSRALNSDQIAALQKVAAIPQSVGQVAKLQELSNFAGVDVTQLKKLNASQLEAAILALTEAKSVIPGANRTNYDTYLNNMKTLLKKQNSTRPVSNNPQAGFTNIDLGQ